jgi:glycosyltransferase involved in cell wall biosynthesis
MHKIALVTRNFFANSRLEKGIICWTGESLYYMVAKKLAELDKSLDVHFFSFETTGKRALKYMLNKNNFHLQPVIVDSGNFLTLLQDIWIYTKSLRLHLSRDYRFLIGCWYGFKYPNLMSSLNFISNLVKESFESIHIGYPFTAFTLASYLLKSKKRIPIKVVMQPLLHDALIRGRYFRHFVNMTKSLDAIVVSTPYEEKLLSDLRVKNVYFVGEGVDLDYIERILMKKEDLSEIDHSSADYNILWIGRRFYYKGFYHVLLALHRLKSRGLNVRLILVGEKVLQDKVPRKLRHETLGIIDELEKSGNLLDLGIVDEQKKYALIKFSDFVILPSNAETIPLVFLEAWALRKAVIGANIPTVASIINRPGDGGLLIPFGDINKLTEAMYRLCTDDNFRDECGIEGFKKVREVYNITSVAKRLKKVYESI